MDDFFKQIECLSIIPRKRLSRGSKGNYKASGFGNSLDFYGHRKYINGDDVKRIDWKAYIRTEEFFVKEFNEQRQMNVNVILDNSLSMDFGNINKFSFGKMLSLGIIYLTLKQSDTASFYTVNEKLNTILKNIRGKENLYNFIKKINEVKSTGGTNISEIKSINSQNSSLTFIISDCLDKNIDKILDYLSVMNNEVILIHTLANEEISPDYKQELKLIDSETKEIIQIQLNKAMRKKYTEKINNFIKETKHKCEIREIKYVLANTSNMPFDILGKAVGGV